MNLQDPDIQAAIQIMAKKRALGEIKVKTNTNVYKPRKYDPVFEAKRYRARAELNKAKGLKADGTPFTGRKVMHGLTKVLTHAEYMRRWRAGTLPKFVSILTVFIGFTVCVSAAQLHAPAAQTPNLRSNLTTRTSAAHNVATTTTAAKHNNSKAATAPSFISDEQAVNAIIGEAGNQSYEAQLAIANVIRHRGSLRGIYGVTNPCVAKSSAATRSKALKAWRESATRDIVPGCAYFGCPADAAYFKKIGAVKVTQIGAISFYK